MSEYKLNPNPIHIYVPPLLTLTNYTFLFGFKKTFDLFEIFDLRVVSECCIKDLRVVLVCCINVLYKCVV